MKQLAIVDYGMGNIESILNAFKRLGFDCLVSQDAATIAKADAIILPGVGAFHAAMRNLHELNFIDLLNEQIIHRKKPFLGICLGMQLLAEDSIETEFTKGLGWINGHVIKIATDNHLPVPHVGWNEIQFRDDDILFKKIKENSHFFFDHSFHLICDEKWVTASCDYGHTIVAAIQKENIFAVQFHPEKSQRNGARLLRNFLNYVNS